MTADPDLDDTDRQLLNALLRDGRASARELAAATGVATATVTKRIQRLEDAGVIEEYRPQLDYAAAGYDVTALFHLDVAGQGLPEVVEELQANERMIGVYEVTGSHDVVAVGKFTSTDEMNAQIKELLTDEHVRSATTNVVLDIVREYVQFPTSTEGN
jgi:DNA-binding Lrp family transcriptional regulator